MPELTDYKVDLDNYYGPLDLLLHLVKETEVDITTIALARACEQYISFLTTMERVDINLSGNFLALASQLLLIKSRTLAPPETAPAEEGAPGEEEAEEDASLDLIRKLLEYKRFKDRARALDHLAIERSRKFERPRIRLEGETEAEPLRNLELWDLVLLFSRVVKSTRLEAALSILYRDIPLEVFIEKILRSLTGRTSARFFELVPDRADRTQVLGTFLALLQLAKDQKIRVEQEVDHGDIRIELAEDKTARFFSGPAGIEIPDAPAPLPAPKPISEATIERSAYGYSVVEEPPPAE